MEMFFQFGFLYFFFYCNFCPKFVILVLLLFDIIHHCFVYQFPKGCVHLRCCFLNLSLQLFASRMIKSSLLYEEGKRETEGEKRMQQGQMHSVLLGCRGQLLRLPALKEAVTGWQRLWQSSSANPSPILFCLQAGFGFLFWKTDVCYITGVMKIILSQMHAYVLLFCLQF